MYSRNWKAISIEYNLHQSLSEESPKSWSNNSSSCTAVSKIFYLWISLAVAAWSWPSSVIISGAWRPSKSLSLLLENSNDISLSEEKLSTHLPWTSCRRTTLQGVCTLWCTKMHITLWSFPQICNFGLEFHEIGVWMKKLECILNLYDQ